MTEQNSGAPGGAPGGTPANSGSNNAGPARPSMPTQSAGNPEQNNAADNPRSRGFSPAADARQQQQTPPAEQMIRVGDAEYTAADVQSAMQFKAERDVRKNTLPKSEAEYLARNSENFQLPENVNFSFDERDPLLAQPRKMAMARGMSQEDFSAMLDLHVASKVNELTNQAQARERNMQVLGAAGPQRIQAVETFLKAYAGEEGQAVGQFLKQYPMAPMVKCLEKIIRRFSNQGGADFDQRGRVAQTEDPGKISNYENLSFTQRRVEQMKQNMSRPGYRGNDR